ncbi:MAG: hypothetical protein OHK0031_11950 [Anaerolineales bacterium]
MKVDANQPPAQWDYQGQPYHFCSEVCKHLFQREPQKYGKGENPKYKTACGGEIKDPAQYPSAEYRSERVYFCTQACLRAFEQAPDDFMAGNIEHPLDEFVGEQKK